VGPWHASPASTKGPPATGTAGPVPCPRGCRGRGLGRRVPRGPMVCFPRMHPEACGPPGSPSHGHRWARAVPCLAGCLPTFSRTTGGIAGLSGALWLGDARFEDVLWRGCLSSSAAGAAPPWPLAPSPPFAPRPFLRLELDARRAMAILILDLELRLKRELPR
jgi:hypothetical protein